MRWDLWVQDMLELNPNTGKPRQIQQELGQPKSHPSMCSPLSVPAATNWDAKAQQSSGNITQSREIIGRARRERASTWIQHSIVTAMGFQRHRDRGKKAFTGFWSVLPERNLSQFTLRIYKSFSSHFSVAVKGKELPQICLSNCQQFPSQGR